MDSWQMSLYAKYGAIAPCSAGLGFVLEPSNWRTADFYILSRLLLIPAFFVSYVKR